MLSAPAFNPTPESQTFLLIYLVRTITGRRVRINQFAADFDLRAEETFQPVI